MKTSVYLAGLALLVYGNAWLCNVVDVPIPHLGDLVLAALVMADTLAYHFAFWRFSR